MTPFVIDFLVEGHETDDHLMGGHPIFDDFIVTTRCNVITSYNVATKEHHNDVVTFSCRDLFYFFLFYKNVA